MVEELHHVNLLELNGNSPLFTNENLPTDESFGSGVTEVQFEPTDIIPEEPSKIIEDPPTNSIQRTLELNLEYQSLLREQLKRIEQAQQRNAELQKKIRLVITQARTKNKLKSGKGGGYFVDQDGNSPPENVDAQRKQKMLAKIPLNVKYKKWTKSEIKKLSQGVREQNQERMVAKLMEEFQRTGNTNLDQFNKEMTRIRNMSEEELEKNIQDINWDILAKRHVPGRNGIDCKIRWFNVDDPNINKAEWSKDEDKMVLALAKEHQAHDWESISRELATGRTPLQCFKRYQRSLNTSMMRSKWTAEEDRILEQAVKRYGEKNWQQVANCLEGRTGQQCLHRWQKTLNPFIRRGRWTAEEDKMLSLAVRAYGAKMWVKVQQHVPGRTDVQCRERWVNILNPDLKQGPWTPEEDQKLKSAIDKHGLGKWAAIAHDLYPRTDNQCWRRWKTLNTDEVEGYRQNIYKKRKGLVNNFVGREKERPSLTPDDFEIDPKEAKKKKKKKAPAKKKRKARSDDEEDTEDDVDEESIDDEDDDDE